MDIIRALEEERKKKKVPEFRVGDTVRVQAKIVEGGKERLQSFEGIVIKRQGGGLRENFTVRRVVHGVGVERTFPLHSPKLENVKVLKRGKVRRAKLYYLRGRVGSQATKVKEAS